MAIKIINNGDGPMLSAPSGSQRQIWAAIIMLAAIVVSCGTGVLSWLGGANPPNAVIAAVAAFAGTAVFGFTVFNFLTNDRT